MKLDRKSKKLLQFVTFLIIHMCRTSGLEPEPYRVPAPAPAKLCGPFRLRLRHTGSLQVRVPCKRGMTYRYLITNDLIATQILAFYPNIDRSSRIGADLIGNQISYRLVPVSYKKYLCISIRYLKHFYIFHNLFFNFSRGVMPVVDSSPSIRKSRSTSSLSLFPFCFFS
jgi:hypothetical protein